MRILTSTAKPSYSWGMTKNEVSGSWPPQSQTGALGLGGPTPYSRLSEGGVGVGVHGVWASSNDVPSQPGHYPSISDAQKNFHPTEYTLTPVYRSNITPLTTGLI